MFVARDVLQMVFSSLELSGVELVAGLLSGSHGYDAGASRELAESLTGGFACWHTLVSLGWAVSTSFHLPVLYFPLLDLARLCKIDYPEAKFRMKEFFKLWFEDPEYYNIYKHS